MEKNPLLEMKHIRKKFPGVLALDDVGFNLRSGEVHGVLGENGAGKSTLINVLGGVYPSDNGEIFINGELKDIKSVQDAKDNHIAIIHQELMLVPEMTVAQNIFLGCEPTNKARFIDRKKLHSLSQDVLKKVGLNIDSDEPVKYLSVAKQQMVEIAKALSENANILVMDEPTSSLTQGETDTLFEIIKDLKKNNVGIIYISHRMSELFEITDRITVLRDGRDVGTFNTKEANIDSLVKTMVGRELTSYYTHEKHKIGDTVLECKNISSKKNGVKDVSFSIKAGEIVGFSGLVGAGRSELFRSILGIDPMDVGEIYINGEKAPRLNPNLALKYGIALVPENRKEEGLILENTVGFNITLEVLKDFIKGCFVNKKKKQEIEQEQIKNLNIKTPSTEQRVINLSGGNQQKIVIGKWLAAKPKILILDEPTRGIDVGAKSEIYKIIDNLADKGIAIIMISSELPEIINMCDRIIVMQNGKTTGELKAKDFTQEKIMRLATIEEA